MKLRDAMLLALASLLLFSMANCGIISAPVSLPAAVARNATYTFKGTVIDQTGNSLNGVLATLNNVHHVWTPIEGATDNSSSLTRRVDGAFVFEARGSVLEMIFHKEGFNNATYHFNADQAHDVSTEYGTWPNIENFPVVLLTDSTGPAMAHFNAPISYANYPIADTIAINNLATDGRAGDITYSGKDATDPTVFPPGTLYLTMEIGAPPALNAKGDIDPNELDLPHHITLHLPGPLSGLIRIEPRLGFYPMATSDTAPATGYNHELTIPRKRLKEMRMATPDRIIEAHEYFFFHTNNRFGKGLISWANHAGKPSFRYELYVQPQIDDRDLTSRKVGACSN